MNIVRVILPFIAALGLAICTNNSCATAAEDESTATLSETMEWLTGFVTSRHSGADGMMFTSLTFDRGTLYWKSKDSLLGHVTNIGANDPPDAPSRHVEWAYTTDPGSVPLKSLDYLSVNVARIAGCYGVQLNVANGRKLINGKASQKWFYFDDLDSAERVARAFRHAIKVSGAKLGPF